ncbi:hypothetical protein NC651_011655 [Populus alba x Populus x berolinensis]|nr:hypothetical protein NC651_011655 [Populus alba x Populus x berolinensis]
MVEILFWRTEEVRSSNCVSLLPSSRASLPFIFLPPSQRPLMDVICFPWLKKHRMWDHFPICKVMQNVVAC